MRIRRALLAAAGGAAAVLITASPAPAVGTWQVDSSPNPAGSTFSQLNATFAASHTQAWAVGQTRVAASGDGFETLIEEWHGSTWSVVPGAPASVSASSLNGVSGSGPGDIWAVGQNANASFIEHWNGQSWSQVASPAGGPDGQLNAVSADSPADAWAAGSADVNGVVAPLIEHWNGTQWSQVANPAGQGAALEGVDALSANDVWVINLLGSVTEQWNGTRPPSAGGLSHLTGACVHRLRATYGTPGGATAAGLGLTLAGAVAARTPPPRKDPVTLQ